MTVQPTGVGDFTGTTAIVPADLPLDQQTSQTIAANSSVTYGPYVITSPSYAIALDCELNNSGTICVLKAVMEWTDSATGLTVDLQTWYWTGTPQNPPDLCALTTGRGPTNADTLTVTLYNYDPAQAVTIDYAVWQSSRIVTRHDWRMVILNGLLFGFTEPITDLQSGELAWIAQTSLGASSNTTWLLPLYAGQVLMTWQFGSATNMTLDVYAPMPDQAAANQPQVFNPNTPSQGASQIIAFPRCPMAIKITNANTSAVNVRWSVTIVEYSS